MRMGSLGIVGQTCKITKATMPLTHGFRPCHLGLGTIVVVVVALLCCPLTQVAADIVYQLQCPKTCECGLGKNSTSSSSFNCSSRRFSLHITTMLQIQPNTSLIGSSKEYGETVNGTATNVPRLEPGLELLDISLNNLTSVSAADIFQMDQSPKVIDLPLIPVHMLNASHNRIEILTDAQFANYTKLYYLDLSCNMIRNVSDFAFDGMESLQWLDLSNNLISVLRDTQLSSLVNLHSLDLSQNQLQEVPNLSTLSALQYLNLNQNRLHNLPGATAGFLPPMPSLRYLDLSYNPLRTTRASMFSTLPALTALNLSSCSISHLDAKFLQGASSLRELWLDGNNLTSIAGPVFQNTSLLSLSLSSMSSLANLSHDTFQGLSRLHYLNVSHNPGLSFVHPQLLSPLTQLEHLDLSHCSIPLLSHMTFHNNQVLKTVYLSANPLSCSCVNAWLVQEVHKAADNSSSFKDVESLSCVNASSQQAQPLVPQSFPCDEIQLHSLSSKLSVHLGGQLLLRCNHSSASEPGLVRWTTPGKKVLLLHDFHPQAKSHLLTEQDIQPGTDYHKGHYWHSSTVYYPHLSEREDRVIILADGSLYIDYMLRTDAGRYECHVSNAQYNKSATVFVYLNYKISGDIQIYAFIVGFLCALAFFTLNLIYVIISWIARRLVNKRRREIIRQMLENMNAYKSTQITRIQENYTYQLGRVRNQYHMQRDRLHRNYSQQVNRMKRGCSNQVEKVRENYTSRLAQLRDYSSNQIVQIRERANNQIIRIRDYGTSQLEKLRETYKLQHLHVMKLLDTMNLDNCRHIVETECMRAESMMFDIDLLGDDLRTDSPMSGVDSEYTTPDTSPAQSLEENAPQGLTEDMAQRKQPRQKILYPARDSPPILLEMQSTLTSTEGGLALDVADQWEYTGHSRQGRISPHRYLMNLYIPSKNRNATILQLQSEPHLSGEENGESLSHFKESFPLPVLFLEDEEEPCAGRLNEETDQAETGGSPFMTPEASPTKKLKPFPIDSQELEANTSEETDL